MSNHKKPSSALALNEAPAPGIDSITKIRDADFKKTYDRLVTDKRNVIWVKEVSNAAA